MPLSCVAVLRLDYRTSIVKFLGWGRRLDNFIWSRITLRVAAGLRERCSPNGKSISVSPLAEECTCGRLTSYCKGELAGVVQESNIYTVTRDSVQFQCALFAVGCRKR